jgi:hypothetical protein
MKRIANAVGACSHGFFFAGSEPPAVSPGDCLLDFAGGCVNLLYGSTQTSCAPALLIAALAGFGALGALSRGAGRKPKVSQPDAFNEWRLRKEIRGSASLRTRRVGRVRHGCAGCDQNVPHCAQSRAITPAPNEPNVGRPGEAISLALRDTWVNAVAERGSARADERSQSGPLTASPGCTRRRA